MAENKELTRKEETMPEKTAELPGIAPLVDIYENDDEILLYADMPGVDKDKISINIDNGKLFLTGLRKIEAEGAANWTEFEDIEYQRTFSIPQTIDVEKVNAVMKEGVLELHLPKSEAAKPRKIEIKSD